MSMSRRAGIPDGGVAKDSPTTPPDGSMWPIYFHVDWTLRILIRRLGQEKQKMLLAADGGHFSMIRYHSLTHSRLPRLHPLLIVTVLLRALHLADLITEMNGMSPTLSTFRSLQQSVQFCALRQVLITACPCRPLWLHVHPELDALLPRPAGPSR